MLPVLNFKLKKLKIQSKLLFSIKVITFTVVDCENDF